MGLQKGCPCCKIHHNDKEFIKVMDFSAGLVIYRVKDSQPEKKFNTNDMFIIHNETNRHVSTANCMSEIEETVYCPRCRYIMKHAKDLLLNISFIKERDVIGICDHCRLRKRTYKPCTKCETVIKEFIKDNQKSKTNTQKNNSKQVKELKSRMKDFLIDVPEARKLVLETGRRTLSEPSLDKINISYKSRSDRDNIMSMISKCVEKEFVREIETRQLYDNKRGSELSVIDALRLQKNIEFKRNVQFTSPKHNVSLKSFTESADYISLENKYNSQKANTSRKKAEVLSKPQPSSEHRMSSDTFIETKTIEGELKLKREEKNEKQIFHDGKYTYKKKPYYSYDDIRYLKHHEDSVIEKELLKKVRKSTESDSNIAKYISDESFRSLSAATRQISRKDFSYFFIKKSDFAKKRQITNFSSSELVKNTQDMYRERAEKARIEKEQEEDRRLKEEEKKRIAIEERKKQKDEERRIKELKKKIAEEEEAKKLKQKKDEQELKRKTEEEAEIVEVPLKPSRESKMEKQSHISEKDSLNMKELDLKKKEKQVTAKAEKNEQRSADKKEKQRKNEEKERERAEKQEQMHRAQETKERKKEEKEKEKQEQMHRAQETKERQEEEKKKEKQEQIRRAQETKERQKEEKEKEKQEQMRRAQEAKQRGNHEKEKEKAPNEEQIRLNREEKPRLKEDKEKKQRIDKEDKQKPKEQKEVQKPQNERIHLTKEEKPSQKGEISKEKEDIVKIAYIDDQTTKGKKNDQNMAALILGKKKHEDEKRKQEDERKKQEAQKRFKSLKEIKEEVKSEKPEPKKVVEEPQKKELNINQVEIRRPSADDLILELVKLKQQQRKQKVRPTRLSQINISENIVREHKEHKSLKNKSCIICLNSDLELDIDMILNEKQVDKCNDIIIGQKIFKYKPPLPIKSEEVEKGPLFFASKHMEDDIILNTEVKENIVEENERNIPPILAGKYVSIVVQIKKILKM